MWVCYSCLSSLGFGLPVCGFALLFPGLGLVLSFLVCLMWLLIVLICNDSLVVVVGLWEFLCGLIYGLFGFVSCFYLVLIRVCG